MKHTKPKSQRRRINDAATPRVSLGGSYYNPKLKIEVHPCGHPEKAVTFELDDWQWAELCRNVKTCAEAMAKRFESIAKSHAHVFQLGGQQ